MLNGRKHRTRKKDFIEWQMASALILFSCMFGFRVVWPENKPSVEFHDEQSNHVAQRRLLQSLTYTEDPKNGSLLLSYNSTAPGTTNVISVTTDILTTTSQPSRNNTTTEEPPGAACTEPAYLEFPPDVFTDEQRRQGALIIHALIVVYMFVGLAIVCDDYFVASLDRICEKLGLGEDVAGATFMAAGSSAPEFFTSLIGVFVAKGDVGVGTIVGSAVFNILFVIGMCALLVKDIVTLNWWPLTRDSAFYSISVLVLILSIRDFHISWIESLLMMCLYAIYILIMRLNPRLQEWITSRWSGPSANTKSADPNQTILPPVGERKYYGGAYGEQDSRPSNGVTESAHEANGLVEGVNGVNRVTTETTANGNAKNVVQRFYDEESPPPYEDNTRMPLTPMPTSHQHGDNDRIRADEYYGHVRTSFYAFIFRVVVYKSVKNYMWRGAWQAAARTVILTEKEVKKVRSQGLLHFPPAHYGDTQDPKQIKEKVHKALSLEQDEESQPPFYKPPNISDGCWPCLKWFLCFPLSGVLFFSIPDCRKPRWENWYMLTFFMSMFWIVAFSYVMVWMVTLIGYTLGIPDSIMGITFLAAGTSVPDCIASVMVARQGLGDMAISNTIGSNIFDILICLAFPWFLKTGVIYSGSLVHINSNGLLYESILLFTTVIVTLVSVHCVGWILTKKLGVICMSTYAVFIVFACLIEFNVFGYVNPPMCPK